MKEKRFDVNRKISRKREGLWEIGWVLAIRGKVKLRWYTGTRKGVFCGAKVEKLAGRGKTQGGSGAGGGGSGQKILAKKTRLPSCRTDDFALQRAPQHHLRHYGK